ncbi:tRNA amino-acyl synthetase [Mucilaginibacter sp. JRF]|uniref:tRNA amino-acyl synthetase n=1 Tax=Mucilaginibacter sp. JRF TaxID=2780088 RepID=UPI001880038F|nr:tRNA amino-acyl synthetase [Mucilaginibacter sp. JRF]MBE9584006.1 tRNA amino-acyl synthetase [Mucilaginibacter sp. JRF]
MQVVYISKRFAINKSEAMAWFKPFCESEDLHIYNDFNLAKEFLERVVEGQKHIDFIITDWEVNVSFANEIVSWLRNSEHIYSSKNFQLRALPILLIEDDDKQSSAVRADFDQVVSDFPTNPLKLRTAIKSAIKKWRYSLANDLDLIGLDPKTLTYHPNDRKAFISYYRLKVLTKDFVNVKSKRLNYIWANSDAQLLNQRNEQFEKHIYRATYNPSKYMEKETHDFLKNNNTLLLGENYSKPIYEPRLYKLGNKIDIPDFINTPHEYSLRSPEIFEVKRWSQKIIRSNERFISKAKKSFGQVKRYQSYMESENSNNLKYISKYLNRLYDNYEYTLFMGSKSEKEDHLDLIEQLKKDFDFNDIKLLTYEELLERHIRMCDRLSDFDIFR